MQGCLAPSEIPGVTVTEASTFGAVAEEIIYADFVSNYSISGTELFRDANNPAAYLFFLAVNNPHFTQTLQEDYFRRLRGEQLMRIPDFLIHKAAEKAFYEVKPDSPPGISAGVEKVGILSAVYPYYQLPYVAGTQFAPRDHTVAQLGSVLRATLRVRRTAPGLLAYKLCLESEGMIELVTLAILLRYIVQEMNKQRRSRRFRPVDLEPVFRRDQELSDLARTLGLAMAAAGVATVGWKYFWKAVAARFAVRGGAAAALAVADGPLPIGDLIAAGLAIWTVVDIIRLSDELWRDARAIAQRGA